ncbi:MAG: hypothetical protein JXR71_01400 [Bacteroidales bacterium]|nr:hypothetical protein [Bacteroidales bacterium]
MKTQKNRLISLMALAIFICLGSDLKAQQPEWTEYYKRSQLYPSAEWITGFVSGYNTHDEDPGKLITHYEFLSKEKVVQNIEVEIETQNSMKISNINGKSSEAFVSNSASFSRARINGLRTEHFYDRKTKTIYAFSYVNKKELAFYYKNILASSQQKLEQSLKEGRNFLKSGNKENALKSFYESMPVVAEANQAHGLLLALNRSMLANINMDEIYRMSAELQQEIDGLQRGKELNLHEAAYFVAYGLFVQLGKISMPLSMENTTFSNTGFATQFSNLWQSALKDALIKAGNYKVNAGMGTMPQDYQIVGNYSKEGDELRIHNRVLYQGKIVAVSAGHIPLKWLASEQIKFFPDELSRIEEMKTFHLQAMNPEVYVKSGMASEAPVQVKVIHTVEGKSTPVSNIPLSFRDKNTGKVLCSGITNEEGIASAFLPKLSHKQPLVELEASVNLSSYVPMDTTTAYFTLVRQQSPVVSAQFIVHVQKQVCYIQSKELLLGAPMQIKTIEPVVKETLAKAGYQFTEEPEKADYLIQINASSTTGTMYSGIYFTYVDANLSVVNKKENKEIFKTHIDQVKGGGASYAKAGKKAFLVAAERMRKTLGEF